MASSRKKPAKKAVAKPRKKATNNETVLQKHCQQWLEKSGYWSRMLIFHVPNERKGGVGTAMHFKRMGVLPGVADYLAFTVGRAVAIELKDDKGVQSASQMEFQKRWERAGNAYFIARTLEEFEGIVTVLAMF